MTTAATPTETKLTPEQVAHRLHDFLLKNENEKAQTQLYADNVVSIEPEGTSFFEKETHGLDAILEKGKKFVAMTDEFYGITVSEPVVSGNSFALRLELDLKMKGQERSIMSELAVYTVKDGKVISEQFFV